MDLPGDGNGFGLRQGNGFDFAGRAAVAAKDAAKEEGAHSSRSAQLPGDGAGCRGISLPSASRCFPFATEGSREGVHSVSAACRTSTTRHGRGLRCQEGGVDQIGWFGKR